jgi:xanthine dehydrogenase accessory factor
MNSQPPLVLIRGGGDLASGVALRLYRAHYKVVITEVRQPLAVRRAVSFAEAIYEGTWEIEDVLAEKVTNEEAIVKTLEHGRIPILVDPEGAVRHLVQPNALVDGRMLKQPSELDLHAAPFVIGLGPGFTVGVDCHAVVETKRGHYLGRVYWQGSAIADTGTPESVSGFDVQRVIKATASGDLRDGLPIGSLVEAGKQIALVGDVPIQASFRGALRGLLRDGVQVEQGQKIGDLDPRAEQQYCYTVSDKALAVAGGVMEALSSQGYLPPGSV